MGWSLSEDFGLVSFDDYPWLGIFRPKLTTVELPKHQFGREAAELLIASVEGNREKAVVRKRQPELRIASPAASLCTWYASKPMRLVRSLLSPTLDPEIVTDSLKSISTGWPTLFVLKTRKAHPLEVSISRQPLRV